jgi:HK97 family phage major capsid protein
MDEIKLKKELDQIAESIDTKMTEFEKNQVKHEDVVALKEEIGKTTDKLFNDFKTLQGELDSNKAELEKAQMLNKGGIVTFGSEMRRVCEESKEAIMEAKKGNKALEIPIGENREHVNTKVADMTSANLVSDTTNYVRVIPPTRLPSIIFEPDESRHMRDIIPFGNTSSNLITYPQETAYTDGMAVTAENTALTQSDATVTQQSAAVEKIGSYVTASDEMLDDFPAFLSYIQNRLQSKLLKKEDSEILSGTTTISGILTVATAFAAGGSTLTAPQNFDVLKYAITQANVAFYNPTYIVMHPNDVRDMELIKDENNNYVFPWVITGGRPSVALVPIYMTTAMTSGTYLVGDFTRGTQLFIRKGIELKFWDMDYDGNLVKGMNTITISERIALPVYRTNAFITDTFAEGILELTP